MDAELRALLRDEAGRHATAARTGDRAVVLRALHAMKGALALAGATDLAADLAHAERALRAEEAGALALACTLLCDIAKLLEGDAELVGSSWPAPPARLVATPIDPELRDFYTQEVQARLLSIDEALDELDEPSATLQVCFRHVHSIKGAASAVRDEPMAWFCHGLETRLEEALDAGDFDVGLREMRRHRRALFGLLQSQAATLALLRGGGDVGAAGPTAPLPGSVRIGAEAFDALIERVSLMSALHAGGHGAMSEIAAVEHELRAMRHTLAEALRLIGPPKPWGAPAAAIQQVKAAKAETESIGAMLLRARLALRDRGSTFEDTARELRQLLASMRRARLAELFRRTQESLRALAQREGVEVNVHTEGGDELVDRRTVDALAPAFVHLARNSIAHGLGAGEQRRRAIGITLRARRVGNLLSLEFADDGVGADVARLSREASARGMDLRADRGDSNVLLPLLLFPRFSTSARTDDLAGRGLGLDIVAQAVRRLGGSVRLHSTPGEGFQITLDLPTEAGLLPVLWLDLGGPVYGVFASDVLRIDGPGEGFDLARALSPAESAGAKKSPAESAGAKEPLHAGPRVVMQGERAIRVCDLPTLEDAFVRPLGPIARRFGPFSHAVSRPDGALRLILDTRKVMALLDAANAGGAA